MIIEEEKVITSEAYTINHKDSVIQLIKGNNNIYKYRVFNNATGIMHENRFQRLYEAKKFVRDGFIILNG